MPDPTPSIDSLSNLQLQHVEAAVARFQEAADNGQRPHISDFLTSVEGNERLVLLKRLLEIEIENRRRRGELPDRKQYASQFPQDSAVIETVFESLSSPINDQADVETVVPGDATSHEPPRPSVPSPSEAAADTAQEQAHIETVVPSAADPDDATSPATVDENRFMPTMISGVSGPSTAGPAIGSGQTFGDYELISPLGQGGMGVVYKARQKAANRLVALKIIRPDRLGGMTEASRRRTIDRFQAEAHAAARLQHDNLVTVYEVGEIEGCHFFSMQFVEGGCLTDRIRDRSLDNREAAALIEPICRAVHAAHDHGILHRDIKPANILVEDETNRPRIADFGLAKLQDDDLELTQSGEAMGTPPYMPPEQFGNAINATAQSDVYSLGATLYHLLSGRPPFQAASSIATMRQVLDKDPVALRELNPAVDLDLETLCMKCLEKEPERRFQTAGELADELQRYLNGQPILSRPLSRPERFWRWCRRNPVVSSLSGLAAVSILIATVSLAVAYVETEEARVKVAASLEETQEAQQLSEASFQDALEAVNDFFTRVSEERLLNEPGAQGLRRELLELAHNYYRKFLDRRSKDPTVRDELALAHFRVGLIVEELDSSLAAAASFETARDLQLTLLKESPDSKPLKRALSRTLNALGRVALKSGDIDRADELFNETLRLRQELVESTPDPEERTEYDRLLANAGMNLGLLARRRQDYEAARSHYERSQTHRLATNALVMDNRLLQRDRAKGWYNLANLGIDLNDAGMVEKNVTRAIEEFTDLLEENPDDLRDRYMLSLCFRLLADLKAALIPTDESKLVESIEAYSQARLAMETLSQRNPAVHRYQAELGQLLMNLGQLEAQRERFESAADLLNRAEKLFSSLTRELPENTEYAELLAQIRDVQKQLAALQQQQR